VASPCRACGLRPRLRSLPPPLNTYQRTHSSRYLCPIACRRMRSPARRSECEKGALPQRVVVDAIAVLAVLRCRGNLGGALSSIGRLSRSLDRQAHPRHGGSSTELFLSIPVCCAAVRRAAPIVDMSIRMFWFPSADNYAQRFQVFGVLWCPVVCLGTQHPQARSPPSCTKLQCGVASAAGYEDPNSRSRGQGTAPPRVSSRMPGWPRNR
jgi:hypothetical protein